MESLEAKLQPVQRSRVGVFVKKLLDDEAPNLAALLAWGTLSALLPLILGVLSLSGLILNDPQRLDQVYNTLLAVVPSSATGPIGDVLNGMRQASAARVGVIALLLLLVNGSSFFSNMASVFDKAYHAEGRNLLVERAIALLMLVLTTALLVVSIVATGLSSLVDNLPGQFLVGPLLGHVIGWSVSIVSVVLLFLLMYRVLPNVRQGWRDVLPGALLSSVLLLVVTQVFPLYVMLFPPNQAYALFGVFLVFTFWLYLVGFVFVLGVELNAFLREPTLAPASTLARPAHTRSGREPKQNGSPGFFVSSREEDGADESRGAPRQLR
jgi:membrane protein